MKFCSKKVLGALELKEGGALLEVSSSHSVLGCPLGSLSFLNSLGLNLETTEAVVHFYKKWFIEMSGRLW